LTLNDDELERLRVRLRCKVRHHLGVLCPDVEDVVQESLVRLVRAQQAGRIEHPENMGGFVSGVCNNVILEYRRRLWRTNESAEEFPERADPGPSGAQSLELREVIDQTLSQMGKRDCRILVSVYLDGKSPSEICAENGIAESQLKVVLFRAKARFRKIYCESMKPRPKARHYASEL
jgi:RNA polymerase sigma factor (sigma-70 family)